MNRIGVAAMGSNLRDEVYRGVGERQTARAPWLKRGGCSALTRTWIASSWQSPPLGVALGQSGRVTVRFGGYIAFVQKVVKEGVEPLIACPLASASGSRLRIGKSASAYALAHDVAESLRVKHDALSDERSS